MKRKQTALIVGLAIVVVIVVVTIFTIVGKSKSRVNLKVMEQQKVLSMQKNRIK